jgi:hypothetical protein
MRADRPSGRLDIITHFRISSLRASIGTRQQNLTTSLLAQPVGAHAVKGGFEVVKDDCVAETFEDEG